MTRKSTLPEIEAAAARWVARCDAGLSPSEETELERWLKVDERHPGALDRYRQTFQLFDRPMQQGMAVVVDRELTRRDRRRRTLVWAASGAVFLVALVFFQRASVRESQPMPTNAIVVVPQKQVLPDGSVVELKSGASITVEFSPQLRRVALSHGGAHFQVAKNPKRPFVVAVGTIEVRAVGTAFSVGLGAQGVEVLVTEGRVAVDRPAAASPANAALPIAFVDAGYRVVVDLAPSAPAPLPLALAPTELADRLAWRAPRLEFSGTPLAEALTLLNRYNQIRFVIGDPELAHTELSGYFRADNTSAFLSVLDSGFGIKGERVGDTVTLRRAR